VEINDTETYDNGVIVVPTYLCPPVFATLDNYEELLIESGYYTADELE
jgi:putative multiple sugar transport system substrate-binding protein